MATSIRLVRCPKCRKILPEYPHTPLYICGGCGATLQANKHKNGINGNGSRAQESDPIQKYEQSERERLLGKDAGPRKIESLGSSSEKPRNRTSDELSYSCESVHENEGSSAEISISGKKYEERYSPMLNVVTSGNEIEGSHGVLAKKESFSGVPQRLDDRKETRSSESEPKLVVAKEQQNVGNGIEDSRGERSKEGKHSNEPQSSGEATTYFSFGQSKYDEYEPSSEYEEHNKVDEWKYLPRENDRMRTNVFQDQTVENSQTGETTKQPSSFSMKDRHTAETSLLVAENYSVADENSRIHLVDDPLGPEKGEEITVDVASLIRSIVFAPLSPDDIFLKESPEVGPSFHRISSEETLDTVPINPRVPVAPLSPDDIYQEGSPGIGPNFHRISSEEILNTLPINPRFPIAPLSPDDIYLEGSPKVSQSFNRISSEEIMDTLPINPRVPIGSMSKSPTRAYYAGDESESSYDGTDELSDHVPHKYSRKVKGTGTTRTNRSRQKDGFRFKNKQNGEMQMLNEQFALSSKLKEPNKFSGAGQNWKRNESLEPRIHSHPIRTSMTAANNGLIPRRSYMPRSSQHFHGNGSPASSGHNVYMHNGEFGRPETMYDPDPDKVELLRMVQELEHKISRTQMSKQISGEASPFRDVGEEIRTGGYYDDRATGRYPIVDSKYSPHHRSHPQGVGWATPPRSSRVAFSGEASLCRNHIGCRCSHCYHQDLHFSPKLSSQCIHCQHEAHPRHDYDNMHPSYSPSPQHYTGSEFSHEVRDDNPKRGHEMKMLYLREKHPAIKRHLRPVSGGAPIISCYHCLELLQLPADFLLLRRRRCHQLRCNSCNTILKFSLLKNSYLVPYVIKIQAPPPSEMDEYSNIVGSRTMVPTSHNPRDALPDSFSDDLEPSLYRNGSTESGPSVPPFLSVPKSRPNVKLSSNSTPQATNDRKMKTVGGIYQDRNNNPRKNTEAAGPSSSTATRVKPSSEIEELPATSSSPLHRLMGYRSPHQVIFSKSEEESGDGMGYYRDRQIR